MQPLVSIITPSYNSEKFISETIKSVQNQTHQNWELIIVDDCSQDKTVEIIQNFIKNDRRIQLHKLDKNSGAGIARNTAIIAAKGDYITFLDADDLWKPEKLAKQLTFMKANNLPFTFSFYDWIDEAGNSLKKTIEAPKVLTYKQLFFCNYVGNLTGIYDVSFFGKIPISSIRKRQDWIMWLTILKKIKNAQPVSESLAFYRIRQNSISRSKTELIKYNFLVYRQFHKLNFLSSVFCIIVFLFAQLIIKPRFNKTL
jgi:teichuronic acid biosynthesis glycosyltransferase TuaG